MSPRNRKKKKSKKRYILLFFIAVTVTGCIFLVKKKNNAPRGFLVHEIYVDGVEWLETGEVLACAGIKKNYHITKTEKAAVIQRLKENIWIKDVHLRECFRGTIQILIKEQEPIAILRRSAPSLLCADGTMIPYVDEFSHLPTVYVEGCALSTITARIKMIKTILGYRTCAIYFKENEMTYIEVDGYRLRIGSNEPLPLQDELCKILTEMKEKGYSICDMRFKNQIIFEKGGAL